jgi:hypothetical protein
MAFASGKAGKFQLDNSAGTLVDLSSYIDDVSMPTPVDQLETTTLGANSKTRIVGLKDATISIKGPWDPTIETHMSGILGAAASKSFEYGPAGGASGQAKRTGECVLVSFQVQTPVAGRIEWSAELAVTGDVTFGTYA